MGSWRRVVVVMSTAVCAQSLLSTARAEPLSFYAPSQLESGQLGFAALGSLAFAPDGPPPERADGRDGVVLATAVLGISRRVSVAATTSLVTRRVELSDPSGGVVARETTGLGDSGLLALVSAVHRPGLRVAAYLGIEAPTGEDDEVDASGRLPQRLQRGLGGWSVVAGALASARPAFAQIDAAAAYFVRSQANDFDAGDELRAELSLRRCVLPWKQCEPTRLQLLGAAETRLTWQASDSGRLAPAQTGGLTWALIPGLQAVIGRHTAELAFEVPIAQPEDRHVAVVVRAHYRVRFEAW